MIEVNQYQESRAICKFEGMINDTIHFIEDFQLLDEPHWKRFVEQFRIHSDVEEIFWPFNGWRGEFWGKMMRGACFVYAYTRNEKLYDILTKTVEDIISTGEENGRISSYPLKDEFTGWDMWCRKYVLLGMQYYLEICQSDRLAKSVIESMRKQVDYIMSKVGAGEGKIPITRATSVWRGMNSSSILEPIVRLYNLTQEEKYLDFAEHIVNAGGTDISNLFKLAYDNQLYPYQYPMTKAYEMISCFEGLLEFYRVKKVEWHKQALINFANRILESDFTVIGCSGCTNELFDHSTVRQANTTNEKIMQETCVTVTLMKFFYQMTMLTGNAAYADAFERSLYNAYLGSVNTEKAEGPDMRKLCNGAYPESIPEILPFDSYSPLTAGTRGNGIGGSLMMPDYHYYGCCACIGPAGIGLVSKMAFMKSDEGLVFNLYIPGSIKTETPKGNRVKFIVDTDYPRTGKIRIRVELEEKEKFSVLLRNPDWSANTGLWINGEKQEISEGYMERNRIWVNDDVIELSFDMTTKVIYPVKYEKDILMTDMHWYLDYTTPVCDIQDPNAEKHVALQRGPIMLAVDNQFGYDAADVFDMEISKQNDVKVEFPNEDFTPYPHIVELLVTLKNGEKLRVLDYASAGKRWGSNDRIAAWIRVKP